ncbi:LicD family protein [Enterococcus asini]|uniref:LicD family protein n=1 Tax=Enterococcus asini TaxID=57732 RepID=UPI000E52122F|nr:LicD family protein [Enterococcus asini]RGW13265.1 LicD family protein [Enterococcus asini]
MFSKDEKLRKVQEKTLEMAKEIISFCRENNILCYFCGGGAIGAIREKGFIPWDDDLDFFMPRDDYERFAILWQEKVDLNRYPLQKPSREYNDHNSFTTIRDTQTTFIKTYQQNMDIVHGITIDIFPIDAAPDEAWKRKFQKFWALVYAVYCTQVVPENHGGLVRLAGKILLGSIPGSGLKYRIWRFAERKMTKYNSQNTEYITELCVGPKYMGNLYKRTDFASAVYKPFEDTTVPLPVGYDAYLKKAFGDYLTPPPKELQKTIHDAVLIDPDTPYEGYRGEYFLTQNRIG